MKDFYLSGSVISGREADAYFDFNGVTMHAMHIQSLDATVTKNKEEIGQLGVVMNGHKSTSANGTGTMSGMYCTPEMRVLMKQYANTGKDFFFDITVTNEDPTAAVGKQIVILKRCNIDSLSLTKIDVNGGVLKEDMPFTFEDFEIQTPFSPFSGQFAVADPLEQVKQKATEVMNDLATKAGEYV